MDDKTAKALAECFDKTPEEAIAYLKSMGIAITWNWQEVAAAIEAHCFTVAKASSADVVQELRDELVKSMEEGKPYREFAKTTKTFLEDKGFSKRADGSAWRLETIYRTNLQSAYMNGRFAQMDAVKEDFPFWEFVAVKDSRTSDGCNGLDGVVRPANDPFWKTNKPPRHHNCRSRVRPISKFQMKQRGLTVSPDNLVRGVRPAPGFGNGMNGWKPNLDRYSPDIRAKVEQSFREAA